jgi:sugar lactone lactonase YvrE
MRHTACLLGLILVLAYVASTCPAGAQCVGDCNGDGQVSVGEIVTMVNIALGNVDISTCTAGDANHDDQITVNEILSAVIDALNGCAAAPTPTAFCQPLPVTTTSALWVSDSSNARVLEYLPPFTTGMSASLVLGERDFNTANAQITASGMSRPEVVAFDNIGNLWSSDFQLGRILEFTPPFSSGQSASLAIGVSNFTTNGYPAPPSASSLGGGPVGLAFDAACNLWAADLYNSRVLKFAAPFSTGMSASLVLGQPDFTSNGNGSDPDQLYWPQMITFDPAQNFWVANYGGYTILEFAPPFMTDESALFMREIYALPFDVKFDKDGDLWVVDEYRNQTREYVPPFTPDMNATVILGSGNPSSAPTDQYGPSAIAFDSEGNLFVADADNNRVLEYRPPFSTGMAASVAIGQPSLTSSSAATTATGLSNPLGVTIQP